ncbi:TonB-dependent receptor plug domain-containing protein [Colwellia sp. MSW7]|uniref:TonB-dependent receptor plug domain-containing protein n=1 Tax=Colwellia maritima TaxID=2912588 RepID=A0ABS9X755_9GAMM|nr:TonB-dependent receptor plug domain-containing protein [Colwellia maritima]MCI2285597.1 TonB-dependent receptor plug domain-containing protein [Colwellia maritima]
MKLSKLSLAIAGSLLAISSQQVVLAEEDKAVNRGIEVIEVTATKRITTKQDTPMAIEAISGDDLASKNIINLEEMSSSMPNVLIAEGQQTTSVNIRGMGSGADRSFEQSVAMFVDNVYMPRSRSYRAAFFDMERVEVLRGPQSVIFGLNATAGSVAVHSASSRPGDDNFVKIGGAYESEYAGYRAEIIMGGSTDDLGYRLAVRTSDTGDGIYENLYTGQEYGSTEDTVVRGTLVWDASSDLQITAKINYAEATYEGPHGQQVYPEDEFAAGLTQPEFLGLFPDYEYDWTIYDDNSLLDLHSEIAEGYETELFSVSMTADYSMGDYLLTSTASFSRSDSINANSVGGLAFTDTPAMGYFLGNPDISLDFTFIFS